MSVPHFVDDLDPRAATQHGAGLFVSTEHVADSIDACGGNAPGTPPLVDGVPGAPQAPAQLGPPMGAGEVTLDERVEQDSEVGRW